MFLEFRHLRTLLEIRRAGNLVEAAGQLHLTQSALSHQTKTLEAYFDLPLFVRKSKPLRFTPAGHRLLELAERVIPLMLQAEEDIKRLAKGDQGRLHIVIECHSCFDWLIPAMNNYRQAWPDVELDLSMSLSFDPFPALLNGDVDLVISSDPINKPAIKFLPLFHYQAMLAVAPDHPLAGREFVQPPDLDAETLITYPISRERLDVFRCFLIPAAVVPAEVRTSELTAMILQLVASKRGVSVLPDWVLAEAIEKQQVQALKLTPEGLWGTLYAAIRETDLNAPFVTGFLETAQKTAFSLLSGIRRVE